MERTDQTRAVSPVIGVILMVAITVILAAVIGAFVLEIGDQDDTAPNAAVTTTEEVRTYMGADEDKNCEGACETNLTTVTVDHTGGDTIPVSNLDIKVDGNDSAFGNPRGVDSYADACGGSCTDTADPEIVPQPDIMRTWGNNEPVSFTAGESLTVIGYDGLRPETIVPENRRGDTSTLQWAIRDGGRFYCTEEHTGLYDNGDQIEYDDAPHNPTLNIYFAQISGEGACVDDLDQGNAVSLTWTANSGGRSQQLIKYIVQQSNRNQ